MQRLLLQYQKSFRDSRSHVQTQTRTKFQLWTLWNKLCWIELFDQTLHRWTSNTWSITIVLNVTWSLPNCHWKRVMKSTDLNSRNTWEKNMEMKMTVSKVTKYSNVTSAFWSFHIIILFQNRVQLCNAYIKFVYISKFDIEKHELNILELISRINTC